MADDKKKVVSLTQHMKFKPRRDPAGGYGAKTVMGPEEVSQFVSLLEDEANMIIQNELKRPDISGEYRNALNQPDPDLVGAAHLADTETTKVTLVTAFWLKEMVKKFRPHSVGAQVLQDKAIIEIFHSPSRRLSQALDEMLSEHQGNVEDGFKQLDKMRAVIREAAVNTKNILTSAIDTACAEEPYKGPER